MRQLQLEQSKRIDGAGWPIGLAGWENINPIQPIMGCELGGPASKKIIKN